MEVDANNVAAAATLNTKIDFISLLSLIENKIITHLAVQPFSAFPVELNSEEHAEHQQPLFATNTAQERLVTFL